MTHHASALSTNVDSNRFDSNRLNSTHPRPAIHVNQPHLKVPLLLAVCGLAAPAAVVAQNPAASVEERITVESLSAPMAFLADDLLEGRGVGSNGDALTQLYLKSQFELFGLKPGGEDGSWTQRVPILGMKAETVQALTVKGPDGEATFEAPTDYTSFAARPEAELAWKDAEVVFVGYGIHAPEQQWDDYGDFDMTGKVALVMNNDPSTDDALFAGKTRLYYGRWSYKYEEAARRGAIGCIVIHTTPSAGYPFQVIQSGQGREQFWLPFEDGVPALAIRSWCSEDAARNIAGLGGKDLDALRESAESREFQPVSLGVTANMKLKNTMRELESANVLGVLPGRDPQLKNEVVCITAHFDHLGRARPRNDDDIYNGALDNASGTSAMLNIARCCGLLPREPRRTLLFLAVTAEESGLLGSQYYARHPSFDKKQIVANFNIDGVNIWGETKDLQMVGYGKSSLTDLCAIVAKSRGRDLLADDATDKGYFYRSDHFSFARIGVPSAYFKAGSAFLDQPKLRNRAKASYTATIYHQPHDHFDRKRFNLHGAVKDTRMLLECLLRAANVDDAPTWTPGDEFEKLR